MTTRRTMVSEDGYRPTGGLPASLPEELRATARRRQARAAQLRAWAREASPVLDQSLARRAAELELGAVALELRAAGLDDAQPFEADGCDRVPAGVGSEDAR